MRKANGHVRQLGGDTKYRLVYVDGKQKLEHRVVMEVKLGRKLTRKEVVHHKDGDGLNNNPLNLEVMSQSEHRREHGGPRRWRITLEAAVAMRQAGSTLREISVEAGVTASAVRKVFVRRGIPTADTRHGTTSWDVELARQCWEAGSSMSAVARGAGVTASSVQKAFIRLGLLPARPTPVKSPTNSRTKSS